MSIFRIYDFYLLIKRKWWAYQRSLSVCNDSHCSVYSATLHGHVGCLAYAHEHDGEPLVESVCSSAAMDGYFDVFKYAHEHGVQLGDYVTLYAAHHGHLEILKYACEHGAPLHEYLCRSAAYKGNLDCLVYAHERGAPFTECACSYAVIKGHLDCLKYAHEHGAVLDSTVCMKASRNASIDCLLYAFVRGALWPLHHRVQLSESPEFQGVLKVYRLHYASSFLGRRWREKRERRRQIAARTIQRAWIACYYAPGGMGFVRAMDRLTQGVCPTQDPMLKNI